MDAREFEAIKGKIARLRDERSKAEGSIATIIESWKSSFGISSLEEAEAKVKELDEEIASNDAFIEEQYTKLKGLTSWQFV